MHAAAQAHLTTTGAGVAAGMPADSGAGATAARDRARLGLGTAMLLLALLQGPGCARPPGTDLAATTASPPLPEMKVIRAEGGSLDTALVIAEKAWVKDGSRLWFGGECGQGSEDLCLRTYGWPKTRDLDREALNDDGNLNWTIPGPTFRIRHGQGINLLLLNRLPVKRDDACNPGAPELDEYPDCFHGDNTTNLHYHGFRVSPERPQDWVYLKLRPEGSPGDPSDPDVVVGEFQFRIDPLQEIQAVGTHWYHPHKHGSTALQVVNGMAGAFIVEGYFDDYLQEQLPGLREQVLVIQQINEKFPFPDRSFSPDQSFWVNGAKNPVIEMAQGEIQRWRFVGATQQASSQILIQFSFPARQIAQDGVPFSTENYERQPLDLSRPGAVLSSTLFTGLDPTRAEGQGTGENPLMQLAAGNRVDVLVRAPSEPGDYPVEITRLAQLAPEVMQDLAQAADPPLLTLRVTGERRPMEFPARLPPLPDYLNDIDRVDASKTVQFSMDKGPGNRPDQWPQCEGLSICPPQFFIDGNKFLPERIDHCVYLSRDEEWLITNTAPTGAAPIAHPFHIHVNPFQIVAINGEPLPEPWIWWDTFALPVSGADAGSATIRQRFLEFGGKYVLHCHILGHEDRGMMQNVLARSLPVRQCP